MLGFAVTEARGGRTTAVSFPADGKDKTEELDVQMSDNALGIAASGTLRPLFSVIDVSLGEAQRVSACVRACARVLLAGIQGCGQWFVGRFHLAG